MDIIKGLEKTKEQTLKYFELPESALNKSYGPGKWTIRQLLHHLTDAETVLYDRIRRGISKPNQVIWGFDQNAWCEGLNYSDLPLSVNRPIYEAVRSAMIHMAGKFYESHGEHQYVHSETGLRTVKDEFDKVVWHNEHHLSQIEQALANAD